MGDGKASSPGLFMDIGKRAKDLIQKSFSTGHMLFISYVTSAGATLSTTSIMTEGMMLGTVSSSFKSGGVKTDLSASTLNQITAETTYEDMLPGLKISLSTTIPDGTSFGKAQLVYQRDFAAITATMKGWKTTPTLECTANFGFEHLCLGGLLAYDTGNNAVTTSVAGLGYSSPQMSAALVYNPVGESSITAYCSHEINSNTAWAIQADYQPSQKVSSAAVGGSYKVDPLTTVKARVKSCGTVSALLEYQPKPLVTVSLMAEVNGRDLKKEKPNIGLSVTMLSV